MKPTIIFCAAVSLALLAVILLAVLSPVSHRNQSKNNPKKPPSLALSLYIQQPHIATAGSNMDPTTQPDPGAFIFRHTITEGPANTSRVVGKAQGFIIPIEDFAHSVFNIIYFSFDTPEFSGSLSVQAKHVAHKDREELSVLGGTGSFAFAKGLAVFVERQASDLEASYHVKLHLKFPNRSLTITG